MRLADMGNGPEIFCCQWVPYPTAGNDTSCDICGSVFTLRAEPGAPELPELPAPNFYAADGPAYADTAKLGFVIQSALWSPDFDIDATGQITATCVLCQHAPCDCPEFGTPEYFALIDKRHGR